MSSEVEKIVLTVRQSPGQSPEQSPGQCPGQNDAAESTQLSPSTGDPENPSYIPGLTLHLPTPSQEKNNLFTLFESCARSNLSLKVQVTNQRTVALFIEGKLICTGEGVGPQKRSPREDAATKAVETLSAYQPCMYNTEKESIFTNGDKLEGFELHMSPEYPAKEEALDVLIKSCRKCNLTVKWWDDGGGKVLGAGWSTVLLINRKPICWGVGDDLDRAKKAAAEQAIEKLLHHPVVISNDTNAEEQKKDTRVTDRKRKYSAEDDETEKLPNFTLYLPEGYHSGEYEGDPKLILLESCFKSDITMKMECPWALKMEAMATLTLKHLNSGKSVTATGYGKGTAVAKCNAVDKAIYILQKCQPCVYNERQFFKNGDHIEGLTLHLTSASKDQGENNSPLSQLQESCKKCNLTLSWWDDGGSYVFGPQWTLVLLIDSWPICWGSNRSRSNAEDYLGQKALNILKRNHPVIYDNEFMINKQARSTAPRTALRCAEDKLNFRILSFWERRNGNRQVNRRDMIRWSDKVIERHIEKLHSKCV